VFGLCFAVRKALTCELSEEEAEFVHATAAREERTVGDVMGDLVRQQRDYDAWFRRKVQEGIDAADRGELIPHEEVVRQMEALKAELLSRKAAE